MTQVRNTFSGAGIGNLGGLELFAYVAGSQAEFKPAVGEQIGIDRIAGEKCGGVERGVEDERADANGAGGVSGGDHCGEGRGRADVVGEMNDIESEAFELTDLLAQTIRRSDRAQPDAEAEVFGHRWIRSAVTRR